MSALDHWHPVLLSRELRQTPRAVRLDGHDLVVFRTGDGVGALPDRCGHRAMRLSEGRVCEGRLTCPYHGWQWDAEGVGRVPANPKHRPTMPSFAAVERDGAVWIAQRDAHPRFPKLEVEGWWCFARHRVRVEAPLELVLDNFIEVEHTPTTHLVLGYALDAMPDVRVETTLTDDAVEVYNEGRQRALPGPLRAMLELQANDHFVDHWVTRFSPVYTVYEQYHVDPTSRVTRPTRLRIAVFFNPVDEARTELVVLGYVSQPPWGRRGLNAVAFPLVRALLLEEVRRDKVMIERLADLRPSLKGAALGRFDKALVASRARIARIYRGEA
ncbi:MAG: Rieske 2Fe-2S domain-containing protein [Polyangiales bacterium]